MNHDKKKLLVILGPTATGKTDLAIFLAKKINGEIISCDSRQVYVGLDIGSGKLPGGRWKIEDRRWKKRKDFWEIGGIRIWMYDVADPKIQYTVADYVKDASKIIGGIRDKGKLPIVVGGTGFYLKALIEGLSNLLVPIDQKLRKILLQLSLEELQKRLKEEDPTKWKSLNNSDRNNKRRLVRYIEIQNSKFPPAGRAGKIQNYSSNLKNQKFQILKIGLKAPRDILNKKIDSRVYIWIDQGLVEEVRILIGKGITFKRLKELGLEFKCVAEYLENKLSSDQLINCLQTRTHQYAKRQITWFKKEENVFWFDTHKRNLQHKVEKLVLDWYNNTNDDFS